MKTTRMLLFRIGFVFLIALFSACNRNTYPCPDIHGGTEVVKAGTKEGLKKTETDVDEYGLLNKKPYTHSGMKKKKH